MRVYAGTTCKSEQRYIYDNANNNYDSAPTAGILKKTEQAMLACSDLSAIGQYDATWQITHLAHDSYGNPVAQIQMGDASDGSQNQILYTMFDSTYRIFPIQQWDTGDPAYVETATY